MEDCQSQVKADCEALLRRFQETQSVRFEIFSNIWREMKFTHIFYGTVTRHETRTFSRLVLDSALPFFLPPYSFQIRVGGMYLLFSLYQNQSASPPEQIRISLKDWDHVKKFQKDAMDAQHYDVIYIFRKLEAFKAFAFTAMPTPLAFRRKRKIKRSTLNEEFIERTSRPQELISIELLEELSNVHELYEKLKKSAVPPESEAPAVSGVDLIRPDLVPHLRSTVLDFYKWQQKQDWSLKTDDSGEGTSSSQHVASSRRATLLASIKSKAYGEAAEASKSRRHRQVELNFASAESGPAHRSGCRIKSLKARTNENLSKSGSAWSGDSSTTFINRLTTVQPEKKVNEDKP